MAESKIYLYNKYNIIKCPACGRKNYRIEHKIFNYCDKRGHNLAEIRNIYYCIDCESSFNYDHVIIKGG